MGKFYELFHMDAMIAVNELGLIFMKASERLIYPMNLRLKSSKS